MEFIAHLTLDWTNAIWFSLLFNATNMFVLKIYPAHYKNRVLKMPRFRNKTDQFIGMVNFFLFQGLVGLVIFLPLQFGGYLFYPGLVIFGIFYVCYLISLLNYAESDPGSPVTKGIYRFSRNPQQITTIFMWMGISLMTASYLILIICFIQFFTVYPTFKAQEKECLKQYGKPYEDYMKDVPAYFRLKIT